jgi:flagellar biosynthesis/type III secretory pathway protein FliH
VSERDDIVPFFAVVSGEAKAVRSLDVALRPIPTPEVTSPWSPKPQPQPAAAPSMPAAPHLDVEAIRADAMAKGLEEGRATGLRETEALRTQLAALARELDQARAALIAPAAERIAATVTTVLEAWIAGSDRAAMFAPIIQGWVEATVEPAVAHVHPDDAEALRTAIGDAAIAIAPAPDVARGDVRIIAATRELAHRWDARLVELRTAIAAELSR